MFFCIDDKQIITYYLTILILLKTCSSVFIRRIIWTVKYLATFLSYTPMKMAFCIYFFPSRRQIFLFCLIVAQVFSVSFKKKKYFSFEHQSHKNFFVFCFQRRLETIGRRRWKRQDSKTAAQKKKK